MEKDMDKEYNYTCGDCDAEFTIISHTGEKPEVCPFCGSDLENERRNDEDEDDNY